MNTCVKNITSICDELFDECPCFNRCPTECDWIEYTTSISLSDYVIIKFLDFIKKTLNIILFSKSKPTEYYFGLMSQVPNIKNKFQDVNLTYDNYKKSVAMINVHYSNLIYKNISESPLYEPYDLIGIIGN